jgi:ABC-type multidrug transport system fused ATPase/permease subunit
LLDDPLSAVDYHVGRTLFEECIVKELQGKKKCVLLVTNALQFLPAVSRILVMKEGRIVEHGVFTELMEREGHFTSLMRSFYGT